jgi:myosin-crossreactive antigen
MPDFMRTALWIIAGLAAAVYVIANPAQAGHQIHSLFTGLFTFIGSLGNG